MDMTTLDQIFQAVERTVAHFGRLDILVNNAGIAPGNLAENVREEDYDLTLAVNLKGTFFASQAAGRVMIQQKSGRIINVSSQAGFAALPTESVYCTTKAAIVHITKCLAVEWGQHGINVNAWLRPSSKRPVPKSVWPIRCPCRCGRTDCWFAPDWEADGCCGRGGLPGIPGGVPNYGSHHNY